MYRKALFVSACLAVSACNATRTPVALSASLSDEDIRQYSARGTAKLTGQALFRQGGGVATCAGAAVALLPDTPYFSEAIRDIKQGQAPQMGGDADRARGLARNSTCDAQGNFSFAGLPNGRWVVASEVKGTAGNLSRGSALVKTGIETRAGRVTKVLLTEADITGL
jgi:hypothetical protein